SCPGWVVAMLAGEGVTYLHHGGDGIRNVNITVRPGEIVALVGMNGAGKTTLLRLLPGMLRAQAGIVQVLEQHIATLPRAVWARVGHLIEAPLAYPELTTRENLRAAARRHHADPDHVVETALSQWKLDTISQRRFRHLSLGNRQRVGLAAALQHGPELVILDEPRSALDPAAVLTLREMLMQRAAEGAAVLVSSHDLDEVARIANRILVMNAGQLIGTLDTEGVDLERAFFETVRRDDAEHNTPHQEAS